MKTLSLLICSVCLSVTCFAQEETPSHDIPRLEFGFRFMPTVSALDMRTSSGGTVSGQATFGYGVGGNIGINFTDHVGVEGDILYNAITQKYKDQEMERTIHVNYLNIPIMLSLNTGKSRPVNLNFVAGPQMSYNVGSRMETSGSNGTDTMQATLVLKKGNLGFAYGAGLEFALNERRSVRLDLGFRGVYGFVDIAQPKTGTDPESREFNVAEGTKIQTYSAFVGVTWLFL